MGGVRHESDKYIESDNIAQRDLLDNIITEIFIKSGLVESFSNELGGLIIPLVEGKDYQHLSVFGKEIVATGFKLLRPGTLVAFSVARMKAEIYFCFKFKIKRV